MSVAENLNEIRGVIDSCAREHKRDPALVNLVAVSKRQSEDSIKQALKAGHRLFGENRVQEAQEHWSGYRACPKGHYDDLVLHLIGPLQTNKAREAVALFDVIETLDREKLARALAKEMAAQERALPCFIQVNTGAEEQKAGVAVAELSAFYEFCVQDCGLNVTGLMCIPPMDEPAAMHFGLLSKLAAGLGLAHLSMGMSADYPKAVALGATHVRVGTAVFGARD